MAALPKSGSDPNPPQAVDDGRVAVPATAARAAAARSSTTGDVGAVAAPVESPPVYVPHFARRGELPPAQRVDYAGDRARLRSVAPVIAPQKFMQHWGRSEMAMFETGMRTSTLCGADVGWWW